MRPNDLENIGPSARQSAEVSDDSVFPGMLSPGLTKREYIATQIMAALLVNGEGHVSGHADRAVKAADTLIRRLAHG